MDIASILEAGGSLALSIGVFAFAVWLNRKTNSPLLNPLLVTVAIIMIALTVFNIPLESYEKGATLISSMLGPATAVLAFSIYQQRKILQSNFLPIFVGCLVGSIVRTVRAVRPGRPSGAFNAAEIDHRPHRACRDWRAGRHGVDYHGGRHDHGRYGRHFLAHAGESVPH